MSSSEKAWQALVLTPCKLSTKPVACNQQQYYCICRTSKENVKQKWLLLRKYCGSSAQELYSPHWNSPKPYFLLALSNENSHASLTRHRSRRYAAEQGVYGACTIALVSLQSYGGGHVVILTQWERQCTGEIQKFPTPHLNSDFVVKWVMRNHCITVFQPFISLRGWMK